jgi:anti-sigma28 factor (negative regulator of flagellin synthesis)
MSEVLIEKIDRIEALLLELSAKIDNFLGFEEITEEEKEEVEKLKEEIERGEYLSIDQVFGD